MALVWLAALAASFPAASQDAPPKGRELDTLVAEYVALDGKEEVGLRRQDEILRRLETVEPLDAKAVESWRKKINRQWAKGPKLRKKAGSHFLWNEGDEKRGLYVVGGDARAYPTALLDGHELVNDVIGGKPRTVGW